MVIHLEECEKETETPLELAPSETSVTLSHLDKNELQDPTGESTIDNNNCHDSSENVDKDGETCETCNQETVDQSDQQCESTFNESAMNTPIPGILILYSCGSKLYPCYQW
jgi:hypothetical protein